ncbi:MAG: HepT-like ribonuclease domain-containing protein [Rhodocyclaceae bacterium]
MIHRPSKALRVSDFFADIQEAIQLIAEYMSGLTAERFLADSVDAHKTRDSVIKNLIDIGEAANNIMQLAPDIEQRNSALWLHLRGAYDMRIKLTHGYRSVNDRIVWNTVADYLPELARYIATEQSHANKKMP